MVIIKFSKKFMQKFGSIVFQAFINIFRRVSPWHDIDSDGSLDELQPFIQQQVSNERIKSLAKQFMVYSKADDRIIEVMKFVRGRMSYKGDPQVWGLPEYWQNVEQTLNKRTGDCEDGAILILALARNAGVSANRVFLRCGMVKSGSGEGGHAYVVYRANNGLLYPIDWCYYYSRSRIGYGRFSMGTLKNLYLGKWFDVNDLVGLGSLKSYLKQRSD